MSSSDEGEIKSLSDEEFDLEEEDDRRVGAMQNSGTGQSLNHGSNLGGHQRSSPSAGRLPPGTFLTEKEKRAHHNALERRRRDHIKDSFLRLRESLPVSRGEKLSRAQVLKKASEYIVQMRRKYQSTYSEIETFREQNQSLAEEIRRVEIERGIIPPDAPRPASLGLAGEGQANGVPEANSDIKIENGELPDSPGLPLRNGSARGFETNRSSNLSLLGTSGAILGHAHTIRTLPVQLPPASLLQRVSSASAPKAHP